MNRSVLLVCGAVLAGAVVSTVISKALGQAPQQGAAGQEEPIDRATRVSLNERMLRLEKEVAELKADHAAMEKREFSIVQVVAQIAEALRVFKSASDFPSLNKTMEGSTGIINPIYKEVHELKDKRESIPK